MTRKTSQRTALESVFDKEDRPLTVEEVLRNGQKFVKSLNQATVYRNLKTMVEKGTLKQISHPVLGVLYERNGKAHHHHFHCRVCDRVFELPGCGLTDKTITPKNFITEDHDIFLYGVCPSCAG
jgi:Fur family transcriptional regulator, ferric uptake regulator